MKDKLKNTLEHEVELLGRSISILALAGLLVVGGASAALLTSFGTITGEATVTNAAIQVDDSNSPTLNWEWDEEGDNILGETYVETHSVSNNLDDAQTVSFSTACYKGSDEDDSVSGADIDWEDECKGIDTRFVEYYDEAGHDFSDYEAGYGENDNNVVYVDGSGSDIQDAIDNDVTSSTEAVLVADGDYDPFEVDKDLAVVAENQGGATITGGDIGIDVTAVGATVKGFEVEAAAGSDGDANSRGIDVKASGVTVESNYIHNVRDEERPIGIHLWAKNNDVSNSEVINNYVEDVEATQLQGLSSGREESKAKGIALTGADSNAADSVNISYNTVEKVGDDEDSAMATAINVYGGTPENFVINYNNISDVDHNEDFDYDNGDPRHPVAQGIYFSGLDTNSNPEDSISFNNFHLEGGATVDAQFADYDSGSMTVDAPDNFWGTNGIQVIDEDSDISDSYDYETKEDDSGNAEYTLSAQETDTFGAINSFQVNLEPATYNVTTTIN